MIKTISEMILKYVLVLLLIVSTFVGYASAGDSSGLVGHYYLSGVSEVGSELILHKNGRYEWMLVYGAADIFSRGTWKQQQDNVVLIADPVQQPKSMFSFEKESVSEWDAKAENALQKQLVNSKIKSVLARCPFLDTSDYASAASAIGETVPQAELEQRARTALLELTKATTDFERAAADAMKASTLARQVPHVSDAVQTSKNAMQNAMIAMDRYQTAWLAVRDSHWAARLKIPARPEPRFPAECAMPAEVMVDPDSPNSWKSGVAVEVADAKAGLKFSEIQVGFVFSDGRVEKMVTGRGGIVATELHPPVFLQKITISPADGSHAAETFTVPASGPKGSVYRVNLDSSGLVEPVFTTLELTVKDAKLFSAEFGGSYAKQ